MKRRRPFSIATRIVVVSTVASIVLLGGFGLFLDALFGQYQRRQYMALMSSRLEFVHSELLGAGLPGEPAGEELEEIRDVLTKQNGLQRADRFSVQLLDGSGVALMTMEEAAPVFESAALFPAPSDNLQRIDVAHRRMPDGRHLLLTSTRVTTGHGERIVKAVLDWSVEDQLLADFRTNAVTALLLGTVMSAFVASWIARRSLIPVRMLARAADRIEASRLDERLDAREAPRELRDLTDSLRSMQRRLDESFTRLSAFAADLAHEFRTPLNNLMGEVSVALSRARSEDEYRDVLGSVLEECQRLARTIDSLLFLARADRGVVELRALEFDVAAEIDSLVEYYRVFADERHVRLTLEGSARIVADRDLVRQAVGNLLANAVHYCHEGGEVTASVRDESEFVVIEVHDDGPGIQPGEAEHAFDRFFRGSAARKAHPGGSGLGLAIVRSIATLHGGSASLEIVPTGGTLARLVLPAHARSAGASPGTPAG
ncbi:MAG: heavy metal sensor histidine kinase [Thermoanaerobaculia bacterium]